MKPVLELEDVFRVYSTPEGTAAALQGLTLSVAAGEIVVVFGPSGSGKTTFLRLAAGLESPSAGQVRVLGLDLRRVPSRRLDAFRARELGYADQHYSRALAPELPVRALVELPLALEGEGSRSRRKRADELLERVGLLDRAGNFPEELSGGEKQRVALCAAVARRPRILLADEPTGELDAQSAANVYGLLRDIVRRESATAVIVSHDLASTEIADRVIQVRDGRVSAESSRGRLGDESIAVGRGGWVRLPEEFLRQARIRERAKAEIAGQTIVVSSSDAPAPAMTVDEASGAPTKASRRRRDCGVEAQLVGVERRYGTGPAPITAVSGLDAAFASRRLTAITGPSGSGKTTVLHLLAGLDVPTAGDVIVRDTRISALSRADRASFRRRWLGVVTQDPPLIPFLSSRENVALGLSMREVAAGEAERMADEALALVGLAQLAAQRVERLSMGERERVAIARAIAGRPALLLADEPTARLDQANAVAIGELLAQLVDELKATVVFTTHDPILVDAADAEVVL